MSEHGGILCERCETCVHYECTSIHHTHMQRSQSQFEMMSSMSWNVTRRLKKKKIKCEQDVVLRVWRQRTEDSEKVIQQQLLRDLVATSGFSPPAPLALLREFVPQHENILAAEWHEGALQFMSLTSEWRLQGKWWKKQMSPANDT